MRMLLLYVIVACYFLQNHFTCVFSHLKTALFDRAGVGSFLEEALYKCSI